MRSYPRNSPQAMARIVTIMMACDTTIDDREIERLSTLRVYEQLGISSQDFALVLRDYFRDLQDEHHNRERSNHAVPPHLLQALEAVTDPDKQHLLADLLLKMAHADGELVKPESRLLRAMLAAWSIEDDRARA